MVFTVLWAITYSSFTDIKIRNVANPYGSKYLLRNWDWGTMTRGFAVPSQTVFGSIGNIEDLSIFLRVAGPIQRSEKWYLAMW